MQILRTPSNACPMFSSVYCDKLMSFSTGIVVTSNQLVQTASSNPGSGLDMTLGHTKYTNFVCFCRDVLQIVAERQSNLREGPCSKF